MISKLIKFFNSKGFIIFAFALMTAILFTQADRRFGYTSKTAKEPTNISSDGTGYFAYLPKHIVYANDIHYSFLTAINKKYQNKQYASMHSFHGNDQYTNKFYPGTALLQSPFYLIAHWYQKANDPANADGYALPYRLSISIAAIFYWLIGSIALFFFLKNFRFNSSTALIGIVLITFGTNLDYYTSIVSSMSHVYSYSLVSLFLLIALKWVKTDNTKLLPTMGTVLGLIFIVRPVNILVILILPFLFKDAKTFLNKLKELLSKQLLFTLFGILSVLLPIALFIIERYITTGRIELNTYPQEGFDNILNPQIFNVLFSYRRGFFIYGPVLILSLIGIIVMYFKASRWFFFGWILTSLTWIYIISSWWCWDYGGSLGMRAMIEMLPLFVLPLCLLFERIKGWSKAMLFIPIILGIYLYQVFQVQMNKSIIHYNDMDKATFWRIFHKTDDRFQHMLSFQYDTLPADKKYKPIMIFKFDSENWKWHKQPEIFEKIELQDSLVTYEKLRFQNPKTTSLFFAIDGNLTVSNQANNPFIKATYFKDGIEIKNTVSPFGNQVESLQHENVIRLEFVPPAQWDSCEMEIFHGGNENPYKELSLTVLREKTSSL